MGSVVAVVAARARDKYHARMTRRRRVPLTPEVWDALPEVADALATRRTPQGVVLKESHAGEMYLEETEEAPEEDHNLASRHHRARLGSPIPFGMGCAPRVVNVEGSDLVWRDLGGDILHDSEGLLGRFVALRDGPAEQIAAFARLYGVLGLCKDGRPYPHARDMRNGSLIVCPWHAREDGGGAEPLAAWRKLAAQAAALLEEMASHPDRSAIHLYAVEDSWLRPAHVRLSVDGGRPCFGPLAADGLRFGLFGALAVQLLAVGIGAHAVRKCDGCSALFFEAREVPRQPGKRAFCKACGRREAVAAATRAYRARQKR